MAWTIKIGEREFGPLDEQKVLELIIAGDVPPGTLGRERPDQPWQRLESHMPFLAGYSVALPPKVKAAMAGLPSKKVDRELLVYRVLAGIVVVCFAGFFATAWSNCSESSRRDQVLEAEEKTRQAEKELRARAEEARLRKEAEEQRIQARKASEAAEAAMPPEQKAARAELELALEGDEGRRGFCLAEKRLESIPAAERKSPAVAKAFQKLRAREQQELAVDRKRAEEGRGLLCGDGTTSPCPCHGSHRGCCSHHGGVQGCEPLEKLDHVQCP